MWIRNPRASRYEHAGPIVILECPRMVKADKQPNTGRFMDKRSNTRRYKIWTLTDAGYEQKREALVRHYALALQAGEVHKMRTAAEILTMLEEGDVLDV